MRSIGALLGSVLIAACSAGGSGGERLDNGAKSDRAGVFLDLTDNQSRTLFFECEESQGCDIQLTASLSSPGFCDLFVKECEAGGTAPVTREIAHVELETPSGDVEAARIVTTREDDETRTIVDGGELFQQEPGLYFVHVARAPGIGDDLEVLFDVHWEESQDRREDGRFEVSWRVDDLDDALGDGCAALVGADAVEIVSKHLSDGRQFVDIYACESGGGVTGQLPTGAYEVWANTLDADDRLLASSEVREVTLDRSDAPAELEPFRFLNGQLEGEWILTDDRTNEPLTCEEAGLGGVSLVSTLAASGGTAFDDVFDCPTRASEGDFVTAPLPLGEYTVALSALEAETDDVVGQAEPLSALLAEHATIVDVGVFEFLFD